MTKAKLVVPLLAVLSIACTVDRWHVTGGYTPEQGVSAASGNPAYLLDDTVTVELGVSGALFPPDSRPANPGRYGHSDSSGSTLLPLPEKEKEPHGYRNEIIGGSAALLGAVVLALLKYKAASGD